MTDERDYMLELNGQTFHIVITRPKARRRFRGSVTLNTLELGSGRWDTLEEAEQALHTIAYNFANNLAFGTTSPQTAAQ